MASIAFDRDKEIRKILDGVHGVPQRNAGEHRSRRWTRIRIVDPIRGVQFAKDLEQFRLFFCEDLFSPEEAGHYRWCASNAPRLWPSVSCGTIRMSGSRWCRRAQIDYIRHHVSHIGGFTAARKIAAFCREI